MAQQFNLDQALANTGTLTLMGTNPYRMFTNAAGHVLFDVDGSAGSAHILGLLYHSKGLTIANIPIALPEDGQAFTNGADTFVPSEDLLAANAEVVQNYSTYELWFLFLVTCAQGGGVTEENLENFFEMNDTRPAGVAKLAKLLPILASESPSLITIPAVRAKFEDNAFFGYRISKSQAGKLVMKAIRICPIEGIFQPEEIAVAETAENAVWDLTLARNIPEHTIFKARAVLDAMEVLPRTWYMGKTAYDNGSPDQYNTLVRLVRKASEIQRGFDLNEVNNMDQINGIVNDLDWL